MSIEDLIEQTALKVGPKRTRLVYSDGHPGLNPRSYIIEWPNAIAPKSHREACEYALSVVRGGAR